MFSRHHQVVAVLKGIRNIRHLEDSLIDKLVKCAQDASVKPRVKAAALEAYQADPCASKVKYQRKFRQLYFLLSS